MTDTRHDQDAIDPLDELRAELSTVKPSPEFAARVRERLEAGDGKRRPSWLSWYWLAPAGAAAAALSLALIYSRGGVVRVDHVVPTDRVVRTDPVVQASPVVRANPVARTARPVPAVPGVPGVPGVPSAPGVPEFEVITNQPAVIRDWLQRYESAQLTAAGVEPQPVEFRDVEIAPIEVNPVVVKWLVEPPQAVPGPLPNIRRVSAESAERSAK